MDKRLDPKSPETKKIVEDATTYRTGKVVSVMQDRGLPHKGIDVEKMLTILAQAPDIMQIDFCFAGGPVTPPEGEYWYNTLVGNPEAGGCQLVPEICQQEKWGQNKSFAPYENCSIVTYQGATCQKRLPCGKQEGYKGPYEYVRPTGVDWDDGEWENCGAFHGVNSYFPEEFGASVAKWHEDVNKEMANKSFPQIYYCELASVNSSAANFENCYERATYGLNILPTGIIWNAPYPDDQDNPNMMYPNSPEAVAANAADT